MRAIVPGVAMFSPAADGVHRLPTRGDVMPDAFESRASGEDLLLVWLIALPDDVDRRAAARLEAERQSGPARCCARARRFRDLLLEVASQPPAAPWRRRRAAAH